MNQNDPHVAHKEPHMAHKEPHVDQESEPHVALGEPRVALCEPYMDCNEPHVARREPDEFFFLQCRALCSNMYRSFILRSSTVLNYINYLYCFLSII